MSSFHQGPQARQRTRRWLRRAGCAYVGQKLPAPETQHRLAGVLEVPIQRLEFGVREADAQNQAEEDATNTLRRDQLRIAGVWPAIWQTQVEQAANINTEVVDLREGRRHTLTLSNRERSPESEVGGSLSGPPSAAASTGST